MKKAKVYAIHDFRILKNSDGSKQLHFTEEIVEKSLKHHLSTFYKFYKDLGMFPLFLRSCCVFTDTLVVTSHL